MSISICKSTEYGTWRSMKNRCLNPNDQAYDRYGGRGIGVCEKWLTFAGFLEDMGLKPAPKMSIERLNNSLGYFKENCVWATPKQQSRNRSANHLVEFNGEKKTIIEWSESTGLHKAVIGQRLRKGWTIEQALTIPVKRGQRIKNPPRGRDPQKEKEHARRWREANREYVREYFRQYRMKKKQVIGRKENAG